MCSVERNHILVKTYLVGGASERIIPGRTLTEVTKSVRSFIHLVVLYSIRLFIGNFSEWTPGRPLVPSFRSFVSSFVTPFAHLNIHSHSRSFLRSFVCSIVRLFNSLVELFIVLLFVPSFPRSFALCCVCFAGFLLYSS